MPKLTDEIRQQLSRDIVDMLLDDKDVISFVGIVIKENDRGGFVVQRIASNYLEILQVLDFAMATMEEMDDD